MKNNSPIGFFDSGVGGLSVYSLFRKVLPVENTIYFGDLKNLPYGNKTPNELIGFAKNILNFFQSQNVKAVVIACNTSSALAYEFIKNDYDFKIYPIIQSCAKVIASYNLNKIGVFATLGTVNAKAYSNEIKKYNKFTQVNEIACPNWVSIVEKKEVNNDDIKIHMEEMLKFQPEKIVLGCTHYPYLLDDLKKYAPIDCFINPADIFVEFIKNDLTNMNMLNFSNEKGSEDFYVSSNPEDFVKNAKLFYALDTLPKLHFFENCQ